MQPRALYLVPNADRRLHHRYDAIIPSLPNLLITTNSPSLLASIQSITTLYFALPPPPPSSRSRTQSASNPPRVQSQRVQLERIGMAGMIGCGGFTVGGVGEERLGRLVGLVAELIDAFVS